MTTLTLPLCLVLLLSVTLFRRVESWSMPANLRKTLAKAVISGSLLTFSSLSDAHAKSTNLGNMELTKIVAEDITKRQALITADFTRDIYSEDCRFQDEIDTYAINDYVRGTKALFNAEQSHVDLTSDVTVDESGKNIQFRFAETLAFNVPFNPKVFLTGRVNLQLSDDRLVQHSREFWDQSVLDVLKTVKF